MGTEAIAALLSALAGLLPVALTAFVGWIDRRSHQAQQDRKLHVAQQRTDFLKAWLATMESACSADQFHDVKQDVASELTLIKRGITESMLQDTQRMEQGDEKNFVQVGFLLYAPRSTRAAVLHVCFYLCIGLLVLSLWAMLQLTSEVATSFRAFLWFIVFGIPLTLVAFTMHTFARKADGTQHRTPRDTSPPPLPHAARRGDV